jgi:hypothetical protein
LHLLDKVHLSDWLQRLSDLTVSPEVLEPLIFQLAVILAAFLLAWGFRAATRSWSDRLAQRIVAQFRALRIPAELLGLVVFCYAWLELAIARRGIAEFGGESRFVGIAASLTGLWIVLRASALLLRDALLARGLRRSPGSFSRSTSWVSWRRPRRRSTIWRSRSAPCGFPCCWY